MDTQDSAIRLVQLFREAGAAHHQAFAGTNGEDAAWPAWYAAFLSTRLSGLLGGSVSADVLAGRSGHRGPPDSDAGSGCGWPEFTRNGSCINIGERRQVLRRFLTRLP
jgi:hypothetical protein